MVVYYLDGEHPVQSIPRQKQYQIITKRLDAQQLASVDSYLVDLIGDSDIETSSWIPESPDWSGTPLQPIYEIAAKKNHDLAAQFFGILVFKTFMDHDEEWITGRFEMDGEPLRGRTYFRKRY